MCADTPLFLCRTLCLLYVVDIGYRREFRDTCLYCIPYDESIQHNTTLHSTNLVVHKDKETFNNDYVRNRVERYNDEASSEHNSLHPGKTSIAIPPEDTHERKRPRQTDAEDTNENEYIQNNTIATIRYQPRTVPRFRAGDSILQRRQRLHQASLSAHVLETSISVPMFATQPPSQSPAHTTANAGHGEDQRSAESWHPDHTGDGPPLQTSSVVSVPILTSVQTDAIETIPTLEYTPAPTAVPTRTSTPVSRRTLRTRTTAVQYNEQSPVRMTGRKLRRLTNIKADTCKLAIGPSQQYEGGEELYLDQEVCKKGTIIAYYSGKAISETEKDSSSSKYIFEIPNGTDVPTYIDAADPTCGYGRYADDALRSETENAKWEVIEASEGTRLALVAIDTIRKGIPIRAPYGWQYWYCSRNFSTELMRKAFVGYLEDIAADEDEELA